jgi:hypothetical protein
MKIEYIIPKKKTNILEFIKKYKNKTVLLKSDKMKMEIEVKLEKYRSAFVKSKLDYYRILSLTGEFRINFFHNKPSFENVYIASIAKSEKHSGSEVVKFVIDFLKSFKQVKKAYLIDAATVNCKNSNDSINLSLYKLLTSYIGFYQKYGFRLVINYGKEEDITNKMVVLAKKVANYKVKDILKNFKEIIKLVEKYKQNVLVKTIYKYDEYESIVAESYYSHQSGRMEVVSLGKFMNNLGYLYFTMAPYKKYTFGKFIEKLNDKKCFMLSEFFNILYNFNYIEFKYKNKKIIPKFLVDFCKLSIYKNGFNWNGEYMKKIE